MKDLWTFLLQSLDKGVISEARKALWDDSSLEIWSYSHPEIPVSGCWRINRNTFYGTKPADKQTDFLSSSLFILQALWKICSVSQLSKCLICQRIRFWRKPGGGSLKSLFCLKENRLLCCSMRYFCCLCSGNSPSLSYIISLHFVLLVACTNYTLLNCYVVREC